MKSKRFLIILSALLVTMMIVPSFAVFATDDEDPIPLRVGTFNIQNGGNPGVNYDFSILAADIINAGLDIVGLQEVDQNTSRNGNRDTMALLAQYTGYQYYGFSKAISLGGGEYGTGILSKYPIISYETFELPGNPSEARSCGHAVINVEGVLVDFYNTHLAWPEKSARTAELAFIKDQFADKTCAILTGDLNTQDPEDYAPSFPLCNFANGLENTYVTNDEDGAIDNIVSTKNRIRQVATGVVDTIANLHSDHRMLWADLEIMPTSALRYEDGGYRFYEDGNYLTGWQTIGYDKMYFDPDTGLMVSTDFSDSEGDYEFETFLACGYTLYKLPLQIEKQITYPYITTAAGDNVTAKLTDGNAGTYIDGDSHWYFQPEGPVWYIQGSKLIIGGIGTLEAGENFGRFNDEIDTIIVAPQDPSIKYGGDFGVQTGVVLEAIASGAFAGLTNVTKAYIPDNVTLAADAFDAGVTPTLYRTSTKTLTVAPATGKGFMNENGKTLLKLSIKDGSDDLVLDEGQKIAILYTDGEKNNEGGLFFCSALKYSELQPTYENGVFTFDVCAPVGEDQFIPVLWGTYIANVYVLNADGSIAAQGSSKQFALQFNGSEHAIVTERTADYTYLSAENYVTVDLGAEKEINTVSVSFINDSRYYHWQLYGTNDLTLPLSKWDFLGEKMDNTASNKGAVTIDVGASYRYLRPYTMFSSSRWTSLLADVIVITNDVSDKWETDENEHWHVFKDTGEEAPGTRAAHTPSDWIVDTPAEGNTPGSKHKECTVCGKVLETAEISPDYVDLTFKAFTADGTDVTGLVTDGDFDSCVDGDSHWYWMPEKPVWTIQNGILVIGGVGTLENEGFARFNDEIHTIVVAPQDPSIKYGGDFGVRTGVILEEIASGAFAGLTNVKKAYIPANVTLADDAFDANVTPTLYRTAEKSLTVAPATGYGIFNEGGKTLLKLSIKDGDEDLVLEEGQKIVVVYTDGEKNNEAGLFFCSALKYSEIQPTYDNGQFIFDICAPVGADQFIPIRQATYIANVYVLNADGSIAAQGSSAQFAIRCGEHPIVSERTSDVVYLSNENYITVDLGTAMPVDQFSLAFYDTSDRYYHWQLYGTNDPTLPLCKWDYLGEKSNNDVSSTGFYTVDVGGGFYRYLRPVCAYASNRWTALFAEVEVTAKTHVEADFTVTRPDGVDVTDLLTDGDRDSCVDGDSHWYFQPDGPVWYIQNGILVIGGIGTLENEGFSRFNDEIDTIIVAPQDPSIKYGGDFGVQTGVVLEAIASGAFAGLTNVKKAYIPANVDLADDAFDANVTPTLYRTAEKSLTVAPATGYGIMNENGKTLLKLSIKDGDEDLVLEEGQKIAILYTDGEKNNEGGLFFCSALKYSELQPTYEDGVFTFDICAPVGADQFIPILWGTYIANVYVLNADGSIAAQGSSEQFAIRFNGSEHAIVTERTADYTYLSAENYITVDLGSSMPVDKFSLAFYDTSGRYFHWQLYGTNDPTLPLGKWDFLGEKTDSTVSSAGFYTIDVEGGFYRYLRPVCEYSSSRWTALFAEVEVTVLNHQHNYGAWTGSSATFTTAGEKTCNCSICAAELTKTVPSAQLGVYDEVVTEGNSAAIVGAITCEEIDVDSADYLKVTLVFTDAEGTVLKTKTKRVRSIYTTINGVATVNADVAGVADLAFVDATYLFALRVNGIPEGDYKVTATIEAYLDSEVVASAQSEAMAFTIA